jgi:NRPS condensation-like uncharacterized protein
MTKFKLIVRPQVLDDIRKSRKYYNKVSEGLGDRFRIIAIETIDSLVDFPFYQIKHSVIVRTKNIPNFPFLIHFYLVEESKQIVVLGLLHNASDPESWSSIISR